MNQVAVVPFSASRHIYPADCGDRVRQRGGNWGVVEVAIGQAAMVAIWVGTASMVGGVSSAMASVCM